MPDSHDKTTDISTTRPGGAIYLSELRADERQAVVATMGSGFAPGSPLGFRAGGSVSHLIDPCSRSPRCASHMYVGDSVALDGQPTCPGCLDWRSQDGEGETNR